MNIIVITPEHSVVDEIETCNELLKSDMKRLHIRKPEWSRSDAKKYITQLDSDYFHKISLHEHHELVDELGIGGKHWKGGQDVEKFEGKRSKSFHGFEEIRDEFVELNYGLLSPVFDSISKQGYKSGFSEIALKEEMNGYDRFPLIALGGVDVSNIQKVKEYGFVGAAVLGAVWQESKISARANKVDELINA